jgi:hypothetical protein
MVKKNFHTVVAVLGLAALLVAACASNRSIGPTAPPESATPDIATSTAEPPTAVPTDAPVGAYPSPLPSSGGTAVPDSLQATLADNGSTLTLHVGQTFLLMLGDQYEWDVMVADQTVLSRVKNIAVIRGAQGVYQALAAGTTTLTAAGNPACRQSKPACAMPSVAFELTVVVTE